MPVSYTYGLYPFGWNAATGRHEPPAGSACVLDLRPLGEQAKTSQSSGYGLFAWASGAPGDVVSLGAGYAPELAIDNAARVELRTKLGLSANPSGATLADAMADVLGSLADPTGASMAKPIMPGSDGTLELHLEGHSRIWSQALDANELMSANPKGKHNRIRDVIRADLDIAEATGGLLLLQKCLGAWLLKLGVSREEVAAGAGGKKSQYDRLMSAAVKAKHGANAKPRKPSTLHSESWPNATSDIEATAQDHLWETINDAPWIQTIAVVGGRARSSAGDDQRHFARCLSAVSSADHIAAALIYQSASYDVGNCSRMASGGVRSCYEGSYRHNTFLRLQKWVGGANTTLGTSAFSGNASGATCGMRSNGSTQTASLTGASSVAVTDTAITGNLYGGILLNVTTGAAASCEVGAWSIDDGLGGGGGTTRRGSKRMLMGAG